MRWEIPGAASIDEEDESSIGQFVLFKDKEMDSGLDVNTKTVPTKDNLVWVQEEIRKQDAKMAQVQALVSASI